MYVILVYFLRLLSCSQGSDLGLLLFNVFINDLGDAINHSKCLLIADDLKIYWAISSHNVCFRLLPDTDFTHKRCSSNFIKLNFSKIRNTSFIRKMNVLNYRYRLQNSPIFGTDFIKDLGMHFDCKINFHQHVTFLLSNAMKLLGLMCGIFL
jgi:hypothetical protein